MGDESEDAMPVPVSVGAAQRQSFGAMFNHTSKDIALARSIIGGSLQLSPHPVWKLPDDLNWSADPFNDRNWRAQFHMLRWIDPLRRRAEKGDTAAAEKWLKYARSWVEENKPGSSHPREAWMDMVDGIRALALCVAVPFVSSYRETELTWLSDALRTHADWLADSRHLGHSNHALHQHQGLFVCATILEDPPLQRLAEQRMSELFASAYDHDGVNAEGAIVYHLANYSWWSMARRRLETEGRPLPIAMHVLDNVPTELAHATKPDGTFVSIGDSDGGSAKVVKHPATRWVTSEGADGEPPEDLIRVYDAGYAFARSGWGDQERDFIDETFWSTSFGRANRVHGHPDGGSITFSSMGHEWITDPGKFQYGKSEMRDYCLQRASHSLTYLKDREYDPKSNVECVRKEISDTSYDLVFEDRGYAGALIRRRLIYSVSGEYLVVIDNVDSETHCEAIQNWQTGKGTTAEKVRSGFLLNHSSQKAGVYYTGTQPEATIVTGATDPLGGWVATGWKTSEAAPSLRYSKSGRKFRFVTVIAAGFRDSTPTMQTVKNAPKGELRLRVDTGRVSEQIVITSNAVKIIGYSDEPNESTQNATVPGAPSLRPADRRARQLIFRETRRARRDAWENPSETNRLHLAERLESISRNNAFENGYDLGLTAAINDLREDTLPKNVVGGTRRVRPGLINWNASSSFHPTAASVPTLSVYGASASLPPLDKDTLVSWVLGSLVLPGLVLPAEGDTLTVMLHTAVDRARVHLPMFQRVRFQRELAAGPTVAFGDPTLDLARELRLGWYLGNEDIDLPQAMGVALTHLATALGTNKIVIQGGSGGGFAALQIGAHIPGSFVVAANPQTNLKKYNARAYRAAMLATFGRKDVSESESMLTRIDAGRRIRALNAHMDITLIMNTGDLYHERNHAAPLRAQVADCPRVHLRDAFVDLGPGHKGVDNANYAAIMNALYDRIGTQRP